VLCVKRAGVVLEPIESLCDFFYMKDLVYSIPIDTIEVLREPEFYLPKRR
jgi:hypothetical protein